MRKCLLDTDIFSEILKQKNPDMRVQELGHDLSTENWKRTPSDVES